jgi:hypothetical protein
MSGVHAACEPGRVLGRRQAKRLTVGITIQHRTAEGYQAGDRFFQPTCPTSQVSATRYSSPIDLTSRAEHRRLLGPAWAFSCVDRTGEKSGLEPMRSLRQGLIFKVGYQARTDSLGTRLVDLSSLGLVTLPRIDERRISEVLFKCLTSQGEE